MASEDTFIINVDTRSGQVSLDKLQKKIQAIYGGLNRLTSTKDIPTKGITRYTFEVTKAKKKVDELAKANKALQSSYPRNITGVSGRFNAGVSRAKKTVATPAIPTVTPNPYIGLGGITTLPPTVRKAVPLPSTLSTVANPPPKTFGWSRDMSLMMNNLATASREIARNDVATRAAIGTRSVLPNRGGNWNTQTSNINWIPTGSPAFIPGRTAAERRRQQEGVQTANLVNRLTRANKMFFMMQMATLGVAFSFMTLQNSIIGVFSSLQDLGGVFKSLAMGKSFGGVDLVKAMNIDPSALVQGWKNITGIFGNIQGLMAIFATLTLNEDVMKQLNSFFVELGKALADPKVVEAMQQIVLAAIDFGKEVIKILPTLAQLILILGDTGLLKVLVGVVLIAGTLLSVMSLVQWGFQAILGIVTVLAPYLTATVIPAITTLTNAFMALVGGSIATAALVIAGVLIIVDAFVKVLQELYTNGISVTSVVNGLIKAFNDVYNVVVIIMNAISNLLGAGSMFKSDVPLQWLWGGQSGSTSKSTSITNNYTFSGTVTDPNYALTQTRKAQNTSFTG